MTIENTATTATKLNETDLRRPDFVPGTSVTLADGQSWSLRRPARRFLPDDSPEGFRTILVIPGNDRYATALRQREELFGAQGTNEVQVGQLVGIELALGMTILLANYDLTAEQAASLLEFGYDEQADPVGLALRDAVMAVAYGMTERTEQTDAN